MKKYVGLITIILALIVIILGFTVYDYIEEQRYYETNITDNSYRFFIEGEMRLGYPRVYNVITNIILLISIIAFVSLVIYMIIKYKKYKKIDKRHINILLTLLLNIVLFIRIIIRYDIYEIINITSMTIILNILTSIGIVIIVNLMLKKSIFRWIFSTIGLDILFIYLVNKVMFQKYTVEFEDFYDLKINITCTCIALFIVLMAYLIKNLLKTVRKKCNLD